MNVILLIVHVIYSNLMEFLPKAHIESAIENTSKVLQE